MNPPPQPVVGSCPVYAAGPTLDHLRGAAYPYRHTVLALHGVPPVYRAPPAHGAPPDVAAALTTLSTLAFRFLRG